jgi:NAD(P)-dependent dehydrogenase (short-subunit alcohol dehydrogenase family)
MKPTVLITGAGGALGTAVLERFLKDGYHIHAALGPQEKPVIPENDNLSYHRVDLARTAEAGALVGRILEAEDEIRAAILLVGGFAMGSLRESGTAEVQRMMQLNFETALNVVGPILSVFEKQKNGGQLVFIGSKAGLNPGSGKDFMGYSLSKSLIFGLAEIVNATYPDGRINAHVIVPGTMDTPANRASMPNADFSRWVPTAAVAETIAFALSDTGRMLRESVIKVYHQS